MGVYPEVVNKVSELNKAFLFFRSQDFLTTLRADLDKLTTHIQNTYPNDEVFQRWMNYYNQAGRAGLEKMIYPPPLVRKQQSHEDLEKKKKKLKTVLQKSLTEERSLISDVIPQFDTTEKCIEIIQNCERLITSGKLSVLRHSAMQGEAISHIKQMAKKGQSISSLLAENNIQFSASHCRSLVSLFTLCSEHQTLLKCNVSIRLLLGNIKLVREICTELKW